MAVNIETLARKIKQSVKDILEENLVEINDGICTTNICEELAKAKEDLEKANKQIQKIKHQVDDMRCEISTYKKPYEDYMFCSKLARKTADRNRQLINILSDCLPFLDTASQQEPEAEKLIKEIYNQVFNK